MALLLTDPDTGRVVEANRKARAVFGDLLGDDGVLPLFSEGAAVAEEILAEARLRGTASVGTLLRRGDGSIVDTQVTVTLLPWSAGAALLWTIEDEDEERRTRIVKERVARDMRRAAAEWRQTCDALPLGIVLADGEGRVLRLNEAARLFSGRPTFLEALGASLTAVAGGEPWATAQRAAETVAAGASSFSEQVADPDSGTTWSVGGSPFFRVEPEAERWTVVTIRDVTETVALQAAVSRSERMAAIGALVAGVAHEVRNPLAAVSSSVELLEAQLRAGLPHAETLGLMREANHRLITLMRDLLEYGQPRRQERTEVGVESVLVEAGRVTEPLARARKVAVAIRVPPDLPPLSADAAQLGRAFQNLIQNAVEHSPPGGGVGVDARVDGRWITCTVQDAGPGFDAADLPRVFEPFFTRRPGGTGLGLAIAQKVVEDHGGRIRAENGPQGGGRVLVRLPWAGGAARPAVV